MRRSFLTILLAVVVALASAASGFASGAPSLGLDQAVPRWMKDARIPGAAVAVIREGKIVSVQTFGERAPGVPMTADARFNVASLTKPVFALLTLELVAAGRLSLDTRLADSWVDPDIAADERRLLLTPRLTLSHQAGFPNWRDERLKFDFAPGSRHEYSGEGYEYTRRAIEKLTGTDVRELARNLVLEPAGMSHTSLGWVEAIAGHEVTGFDEAGRPLDMSNLRQRKPNAAAHLFTTIEDYARFAQWVIAGAGLPPALLAEMSKPQAQHPDPVERFGLGWRLIELGGETALSHDGREPGVRTQVFVLPGSREAVVLFTNSNHGELLVRPVVEATLTKGPALMRRISLDTWHFLKSAPADQQENMIKGISRSPSFMSKLLYAVDAALVAPSGLSDPEKESAHRAIDPYILGMVEGRIDQEAARKLFMQLFTADPARPGLRDDFTTEQARGWSRALAEGVKTGAR